MRLKKSINQSASSPIQQRAQFVVRVRWITRCCFTRAFSEMNCLSSTEKSLAEDQAAAETAQVERCLCSGKLTMHGRMATKFI